MQAAVRKTKGGRRTQDSSLSVKEFLALKKPKGDLIVDVEG